MRRFTHHWPCGPGHPLLAGLVAMTTLFAADRYASADPGPGDNPSPPGRRAEQLIFDPATNRWVQAPRPVPGTEDGDLDIARQHLAREDYKTALQVLKEWVRTYGPESPRYPEALSLKGAAEMGTEDYRAAHESYQKLLNDYPGSEYAEQALSGQFRVAEQYLAGKRRKALGGLLRVRDVEGGVKIMDDLVVNYADTPLAEAAQLAKANSYYERGEFELALDEYARFARDFPRSRYHAKALLFSAQSALAGFAGIPFDDAPLVEAQERYRQFERAYPSQATQWQVPVTLEQIARTRADKALDIGRFYEKTRQPKAASFYYRATIRRWPDTPAAAEARSRLAGLERTLAPPEPGAAPGTEPGEPGPPATTPGGAPETG